MNIADSTDNSNVDFFQLLRLELTAAGKVLHVFSYLVIWY